MSALPNDQLQQAREFYRQHLAASFRYSRQFSQAFGAAAQDVVDSPQFEAMVRESAPGSLECARRVGEMAVVALDRRVAVGAQPSAGPGAWWRDLLNYERGYFLQVATTAEGPPTNRPRRGVSALCMNFSWNMPEVIERLKQGQAAGDDLRRPVTILFARGAGGQVHVVEVGPDVERVFRATNGLRTLAQIAAAAGVADSETEHILNALAGIGAVVSAMSPEQMTRTIEQREKR